MADKKTKQIIDLLCYIYQHPGESITAYDEAIKELFEKDLPESKNENENEYLTPKQIGRILEAVSDRIDKFTCAKINKRNTYRLNKPLDVFTELFKNSVEIGMLMHMAHDANPEVFEELSSLTKEDKYIYIFKNSPFEDSKILEEKETFKHLKYAVSNKDYIKITYKDSTQDNLKCLKLMYMENNWYIAYVNDKNKLHFGRVSHIKEVDYATRRTSFQKKSVEKHLAFLKDDVQNTMTLYDIEPKVAHIQAKGKKAKYFDKGMKLQMPSQKFIKKTDDGSIIFTVNYTQYLEILPFLYKWIPHLTILEPKDLKEVYIKEIRKTMKLYEIDV